MVDKFTLLNGLFEHHNKLNSSMQGRNENILTLSGKTMTFIKKFNLTKTKVI